MKKKTFKIITTILIVLYIITFATAGYCEDIDPTQVIETVNSKKGTGVKELYSIGNTILGIIQYIAIGVAVVATLILGIKYMYSAPEEKAEIKKKLIPYIIGAVMIFGAVQLVKLVETFAGDLAG